MRRPPTPDEDVAFRVGVGTVGGVMLASAALAADLARVHLTAVANVCGANQIPHCVWCYAAAGLALAGLAAFSVALASGKTAGKA